MNRIATIVLLTAACAAPGSCQSTFANVFGSVTVSGPGFPFPSAFVAQRVIALYDTNGNGFIDTAAGSNQEMYPVSFPIVRLGRRIGSPFVSLVPGADPNAIAALGRHCGDVLIYAEQFDAAANRTFFMWFSVQDPARGAKPAGCNFPVDFGIGSFPGAVRAAAASNVHHASFVSGALTSDGINMGTFHDAFRMTWNTPGTMASPGHLFSRHTTDDTRSWPFPMDLFVAGELNTVDPFLNFFVSMRNMVLDVPFVAEQNWNGVSLFQTAYPIGRTISPLTGGAGPAMISKAGASVWSSLMANSSGPYAPHQYKSIKFPDVNGDGRADLCFRDVPMTNPMLQPLSGIGGIKCAIATGTALTGGPSFANAALWTTGFNSFWTADESNWGTIQYPDVNGDGKADVCGRNANGIVCALSTGIQFGPVTLWSQTYSNAASWNSSPSHWNTIRFPDLNGDGKADVCARGSGGVWCAVSNGTSFGWASLWTTNYSNAAQWHTSPSLWGTIQYADIDGDGKDDICGRGFAGMLCARSTGSAFLAPSQWTGQFSDAAGWSAEKYAWTIQLADVNGDGKADVCGRGAAGFYCGRSIGSSFVDAFNVHATEFSDANGWDLAMHYKTLWLVDANGDGRADICGRGNGAIMCAYSNALTSHISFVRAVADVNNFGDNFGWGASESHWGTVQPAKVWGSAVRFCGRGDDGILCANY